MLFTVIQGAADIAFILINNNFSTFPSIRTVAALNDVFAFFGDWSSPLLFLAIVLVLEDIVEGQRLLRCRSHDVNRLLGEL